jgi:histidinol-phosphate phosphatase family protein
MFATGRLPEAVFLDRDGVINVDHDVRLPQDMALIAGAAQGVRRLNGLGIPCFIVTNQPGIAKGFFTVDDLVAVHNRLQQLLKQEGAHVDEIYYCPHHPEKGFKGEVAALKVDCGCRKPKPGMLIAAAEKHGLRLERCVMIGDRTVDIEAGRRAGCATILVRTGSAGKDGKCPAKPDHECDDLVAAAYLIERGALERGLR